MFFGGGVVIKAWRRPRFPDISTGTWHGKPIHDGAIHRGDAALGGSRHFLMRRPTVVANGNYWGNDGFGFFFQSNWDSQPANRRPRAGQYYQPMQRRWW